MADEVNPQIVDTVTQSNAQVLGVAPAQAIATLYQTSSATVAMAMQNSVHAQNNHQALSNAVLVEAVNGIMQVNHAPTLADSAQMQEGMKSLVQKLIEELGGAPADPGTKKEDGGTKGST